MSADGKHIDSRFDAITAEYIRRSFHEIVDTIREHYWYVEGETIEKTLCENIYEKIVLLDSLLRNPSVRGHLDPSHQSPDVDEISKLKLLLRRFEKQTLAAEILVETISADTRHTGSVANAEEDALIKEMGSTLRALRQIVMTLQAEDWERKKLQRENLRNSFKGHFGTNDVEIGLGGIGHFKLPVDYAELISKYPNLFSNPDGIPDKQFLQPIPK